MMVIKRIKSALKTLIRINTWKTLYFNFHYLPFKTAIKLPIFIYRRTGLFLMKGKIIIDSPVKNGMVKFGKHGIGTQDLLYQRSMWDVSGTLIITGKTYIGRGCKISIGNNGVLRLGKDFTITGGSAIICNKEITFGDDCLLSWDILMMDSDFHKIFNDRGEVINSAQSIKIGNHVWIGCRTTILKGAAVANDSIIAADSLITKQFHEGNCIIGGRGKHAEVIKSGITWAV